MNAKIKHYATEKEIKDLIKVLCDENGNKRKKARKELADIGESVLDYMKEPLNHPKHICRWEALKVIKEIADLKSIPVFLEAMDDDKSDIRWIAAEGLIRMGKYSVKPLLKLVAEKYDSVFILNGAHHVFFELNERDLLPKSFSAKKLLAFLKSSGKGPSLRVLVHNILSELE
ncbi:MAG TPA: HEAT repeat domain-containing protein [Draconibacterium sp.]|nr:HEAT repeat domain-containing protein [Draconibacterium sp.]